MLNTDKEYLRARLDNLVFAENAVKNCLKRVYIRDYIPGQVIYNLGEYPARFAIRPTAYDDERLASLARMGVGLVQIHEEWNDAIRVLGADKYTSHDPAGLKAFIDLCHAHGLKVIPYISSGFFDVRDPDFRASFATNGPLVLDSAHYQYQCCDPASPDWNAYLLPRFEAILDTYDFDGLFNDMGYASPYAEKEVGYLHENPVFEDLLCRLYTLVKKRGGIMKIHEGYCTCPFTREKVYDYLWVGECVRNADDVLETAKFEPFVVPCPDFRFTAEAEQKRYFARTVPFLQFMLRPDGRPVTGERVNVPGIAYTDNPQNNEKAHYERVKRWFDAHPAGPHVYSEWSAIPDSETMREAWAAHLALYKPMVKDDSAAFIDVTQSTLTVGELPDGVHMSVFYNEKCYLCLSNLTETVKTVVFSQEWHDRRTGKRLRERKIAPYEVVYLEKA